MSERGEFLKKNLKAWSGFEELVDEISRRLDKIEAENGKSKYDSLQVIEKHLTVLEDNKESLVSEFYFFLKSRKTNLNSKLKFLQKNDQFFGLSIIVTKRVKNDQLIVPFKKWLSEAKLKARSFASNI